MADLTEKEASQSVKLVGAGVSTGIETNYLQIDTSGNASVLVNNAGGASAVNIQDGGNSITIDATALPLPTGASTLAEQQTQTTALQLIDDAINAPNTAVSKMNLIGAQMDDASTVVATENNVSALRINSQRGLHVNLRDTTGTQVGDITTPLVVLDKFQAGIVSGNLSVGTSAVEAKVGGARVSTRKILYIENTGTTDLFYGPSGVTNSGSAVGAILRRRQFVFLPAGDIAIYVISSASGGTATIQEMS